MKISIDPTLCTGHGRCYARAASLIEDDDAGYGRVIGDGEVSPDQRAEAELAAASCPEHAVVLRTG